MRFTQLYAPTLKEAPADAEVISHKLMIRAGMIRKLTTGIYSYLPTGWRSINKVAQIVREEMNRANAQELHLPTVQPADLWQESGRWDFYGKELLRFKDRHNRDCCLGPTHEEVITDLIRGEVRSYKQLPLNLYQIQTKFRDEIRPRFGLMRGREFIMKDAYSFDVNDGAADKSYWAMFDAYQRIFTRLGLKFKAVEADSGSIGGSFSHEFMVLADTGEDTIVSCSACSYGANVERAEVKLRAEVKELKLPEAVSFVLTPNKFSVAEQAEHLGLATSDILKTLMCVADGKPVAFLVRGDRELNLVKAKNLLNVAVLDLMPTEMLSEFFGAMPGFVGVVNLEIPVYADLELQLKDGWIMGANRIDTHYCNVSLRRDVKVITYADLREIDINDPCPRCGAALEFPKGIEVGHVFKLGTKYSKALNANILDENGKEKPIIMGCYGIGVTRVVAACIEQNNDQYGISFPPAIAPYEIVVINLDVKSEEATKKSEEIYEMLKNKGFDVLLDDRNDRAGAKFKDADLMGMPIQIIIGSKALANNIIEVKDRSKYEKSELNAGSFELEFDAWQAQVYSRWGL
ncbi:proline--tRNA ligase [Desulfovibrio litoralis]|uniref:Proline--tRNA ligase n=1 Tax=Desulfovibrio litoralis DSM 11393 TaxID=1121455 RepID=A0A1M7RYD9_9BACT|nr:proline--tRNA ligase [Desulfovibrio litoralis]SHN51154.1 prolyl-tRNA synthetase [Desulfovibrio litoralis DSM 11393]